MAVLREQRNESFLPNKSQNASMASGLFATAFYSLNAAF